MKVDETLIRRVAKLARIELTSEETGRFTDDLREILEAFRILDEFDAEGRDSSFRPIEEKNILRDDKVEKSLSNADALRFTKNKEDGFFIGPRTIE